MAKSWHIAPTTALFSLLYPLIFPGSGQAQTELAPPPAADTPLCYMQMPNGRTLNLNKLCGKSTAIAPPSFTPTPETVYKGRAYQPDH